MSNLTEIQKDALIKEVEQSDLTPNAKAYYSALLVKSSESTNGLSDHDKLQQVSEISFAMLCLIISEKISKQANVENTSKYGKYVEPVIGLIKECKNQITVIAVSSIALIYFHPQLADVFAKMFK